MGSMQVKTDWIPDAEVRDVYSRQCPCRDLLDMLADKWTALTIGALEDGPRRFGQLRVKLEGISQKMLTQTLRTLERDGLVTRTVYPTVPLRVDYELTELGRSAAEPLAAVRAWSTGNLPQVVTARRAFDQRAADVPQPSS
ncbi:winged helix-turn-helix transcriptional regulator [Crossiella cryophila]|uniref:DNA-binding HxlR family transcriptional regulator n=1 Tax=Crossiella cryophila TaxID=43355 RepID=A0A7W7FVZ2_9PSEU|nr:helix-turn-helix domain-containing protein [Crossiella cryophila]MBB4677319.1 DNA-binding HxlR family transcriptional regulator [Crossiella cryophila]